MTKRFTITQNGDLFTVRDTVENKPMGVFEFKENEFPAFACFCMIVDKLNKLNNENKQLKQKLKKYEKIEELKKKDFTNCYNCKNDKSVHYNDTTDGMCAIDKLMNLDGCFDTEYHRLPFGTICPYWELKE